MCRWKTPASNHDKGRNYVTYRDVHEEHDVAIVDIPGSFLHIKGDPKYETVLMLLRGS